MKMRSLLALGCALAAFAMPVLSARADTLDDIKKRGEMIIGLEAAYVPYESFKDGVIVGYDVDIATMFAKKLGVKVKFIDTAWSGVIPALLTKKFDMIFSGMTITAERAQKINFTMPYAEATNVILVRANDDTMKTATDLAGHKVGAQLGSAGANLAKEFEDKLKKSGKPGFPEIKLYEHYPEAYQDLLNKRIDGVVNSLSTLIVVMKDQPGVFKTVTGIQDLKAYFGVGMRKQDTQLLKFFNDSFAEIKKNGELAKLQIKWFGATMETPNEVPKVLP